MKCFYLFTKLNSHCSVELHKCKCYTRLKRAEAYAQRCSVKSHSRNFRKIHGKEPAIESFYSKGEVCNFTEKNLSHVSHDFCEIFQNIYTAWKVSKYGVSSGPYFPVFGLNTEIYSVNLRIQSDYLKIRTRKNSIFGHFSRSDILQNTCGRLLLRKCLTMENWWIVIKL